MKNSLKLCVICTLISVIDIIIMVCCSTSVSIAATRGLIVGLYISFVLLPITIILWITYMAKKMNKKLPSPFVLFGIINTVMLIGTVIYGLYDISTDEGFFAGLIGYLLLVFVVPFFILTLLADVIISNAIKKKRSKKGN